MSLTRTRSPMQFAVALALSAVLAPALPALAQGPRAAPRTEAGPHRTGGTVAKARREGLGSRVRPHLRNRIRVYQRRFANRRAVLAAQAADPHVAQVMRHSEAHGKYLIVSDLHWGLGRKDPRGHWHPLEDFRRGDVFARFLESATKERRRTTLVIAGDWLDFMEHSQSGDRPAVIKRLITKMLLGHEREVKALAQAVARDGLRVLYLVGNHDVHLVQPEVREHLRKELMRIGGLTDSAHRNRFKERFAYSGHAAVLGRHGEGLVIHGHAPDPGNNWRSVMNPYDSDRTIPSNVGWDVVTHVYRDIQERERLAGRDHSNTTKTVIKHLLAGRLGVDTVGVLWRLAGTKRQRPRGAEAAMRLDDRATMRAWVERTGFARKMSGRMIPDDLERRNSSPAHWARELEDILSGVPAPIHERITSGSQVLNMLRLSIVGPDRMRQNKAGERYLIGELTTRLPHVRYVIWGHTHDETVIRGQTERGEVAHYNTGSWTRVKGQWQLTAAVATTTGQGRLKMEGLFRTNEQTGVPDVPIDGAVKHISIPAWKKGTGSRPPTP